MYYYTARRYLQILYVKFLNVAMSETCKNSSEFFNYKTIYDHTIDTSQYYTLHYSRIK